MMIVNYLNVGGPGNVAPTLIQALGVNTVVAQMTPTNSGDTSQSVTHMFGLSTQDLSSGWPEVVFEPLDSAAAGSGWFVASQASNFTVFGRGGTTAGVDNSANLQINMYISRPHTIVR